MYQTIIIKKRSFWDQLTFRILYYRLQLQTSFQHFKVGLLLILKNENRWYYDYRTQKVLVLTGIDYWRQIRVDLGEVAYLNIKQPDGRIITTRAELF